MTPTPALLQTRDWARERETDIAIPLAERGLWKQIADEIDEFTGRVPTTATAETGALF